MKSEWIAEYKETDIKITNNWFSGEKLYVNKELQDEQLSFITPSNLINKQGEKLNIKTNISGFFMVSCRLN